jgi:hypothetical protein
MSSIERKFVMETLEIRMAGVFAGRTVQWHSMRLLSHSVVFDEPPP